MSQSPSVGRSALKAFRLSDVPLELRVKAARTVSNRRALSLPDDDVKPEDRLFSFLRSNAQQTDTADHDGLMKVAEEPSSTVYWISQSAWNRVMGKRRARR